MRRLALLALAVAGPVAAAAGCGGADDATTTTTAAAAGAAMTHTDAMKPRAATAMRRRGAVVKVVDSKYGRVLADRHGEAFYLFDKEDAQRSECYGACASAWPPVLARGTPRAGSGATASLLGTTTRRDGRRQVTYAGHPLYYYVQDAPGTILCHDVFEYGGRWLVVAPSGAARA